MLADIQVSDTDQILCLKRLKLAIIFILKQDLR
jgi:hypothetical protein